MNKKILLILIVLLITVLLVMFYRKNSTESIGSKDITFSELIDQGGSYECRITRLLEKSMPSGPKISGTAYVNKWMVRVDVDGKILSLIHKNNLTYNWWGKEHYSYKDYPDIGWIVEDRTYGPSAYQWDASEYTDFSCIKWKLDSSKFIPPSDINFR